MLFLVVLGGAAVLEVHRAVHRKDVNEDMRELREKEAGLRKQLQVRRRDAAGCRRATGSCRAPARPLARALSGPAP